MQQIDFRAALATLLGAQARRQGKLGARRLFQHNIAVDLARDIADQAAEASLEEFALAAMALELLGMGVALRLD